MEWKYVEKETPLCYETGKWDGIRSDEVVAEDDIGRKHIARVYEGAIDGSSFRDWFDSDDYSIDREIVRWLALPQ